jgi:hypothetical protein
MSVTERRGNPSSAGTPAGWVEPGLAGGLPLAGQLRHPRYPGVRRDRDQAAVTREAAR